MLAPLLSFLNNTIISSLVITIIVGLICDTRIPFLDRILPAPLHYKLFKCVSTLVGIVLTTNFMAFWAVPIALQGLGWKHCLSKIFRPIYEMMDSSSVLRSAAAKFVYTDPRHADFMAQALCLVVSIVLSVGGIIYFQVSRGYLTWWVVTLYYFNWVGFGGRVMGGAYTFAHKEGHSRVFYKNWIRKSVGNIFENLMGPFFGNVPYNFTTSHIVIHHKLDGGKGDTFYQWDLDRTSWADFMLFLHRILLHTAGLSSIRYFRQNNFNVQRELLTKGCLYYWVVYPAILLLITRSFSFLFWFYLQPLIGMTFFLAFMNFGFHGFWDPGEDGKGIWCINSITIIEDDDDYFGESDHMQHHHALQVYYRDLPKYRDTKMDEFKQHHASIFKRFSILELSLFILMKDWAKLADHYVDYSESLDKQKVAKMLEERAHRKETTNEEYVEWLNTCRADRN